MKKLCTAFFLSVGFLLSAVELDVTSKTLGGNVRGFGVLAKYADGGPKKLTLIRKVGGNAIDKTPDYAGFPQIASLKVFDPDGKEVVFVNLGQQKKSVQHYKVNIPSGKAGIWRFSVANGLAKDQYTIIFPDTDTWGVRGEMALTPGKKFPAKLYMYVPENAKLLMVESFGRRNWFSFSVDGKAQGKFKTLKRRSMINVSVKGGSVAEGDFSGRDGKSSIAVDGVPGLWCVSPEAAKEIAGNTVKVGKYYFAGPYQARVRKKILSYTADDLDVKLPARKPLPEKIDFPRGEALLFGKYSSLEAVETAAKKQNTDKNSAYYGAMQTTPDAAKKGEWMNMLNYKSYGLTLIPGTLGSIITVPAKLNRAYKHPALVKRACLTAFSMITMRLSGDDIIRENDFRTNSYPHIHVFFAYDSLAKGGYMLRDLLDDEEKELWKEAVTRVGDKAASCMGYESNQWAHMMTGHLHTYMFTGRKRFKEYFETMMNCYLDCTFGANSKYGQHPAGYFLEEYGPDGNYDHLNMYSLVESLWHYRKLDGADKKLISKMEKAIIKNHEFKKFFWLPSPDGSIRSPNALNCRTSGNLSNPSYPGDYLSSFVSPLGYTRWMMAKMPSEGAGNANNFPHNATSDEWALRLIRSAYDRPYKGNGNFSGAWSKLIYEILEAGVPAKTVKLPYESDFKLKTLPGFAAWNSNGIYGMVFYDVTGSRGRLKGITSAGPLVLWNRDMGCILASMRGPVPRGKSVEAKTPDQVTWSAVYGKTPEGKFCFSGKEHNKLDASSDKFDIYGDFKEAGGKLGWSYFADSQKLILKVKLDGCQLENPVISLPFAVKKERTFTLKNNKLVITDNGKYTCTVTFNTKAVLSSPQKTGGWCQVRSLRLQAAPENTIVFTLTRR